jgi:hypothetical protein
MKLTSSPKPPVITSWPGEPAIVSLPAPPSMNGWSWSRSRSSDLAAVPARSRTVTASTPASVVCRIDSSASRLSRSEPLRVSVTRDPRCADVDRVIAAGSVRGHAIDAGAAVGRVAAVAGPPGQRVVAVAQIDDNP